MIAGIVFDKDGTLFDFRKSWGGWAVSLLDDIATAGPQGRTDRHRLGAAIGFDPDSGTFAADSPVIAATAMDVAAALVPHLPGFTVAGLAARIDLLAAGAPMTPAVPLVPVLSALRARGLRLGMATNDTEAPARAHLAAHGITDLFDFIAGYDSGHGAKPGPGQLLAFAAHTGLRPAQVVMVGDSRHDLVAGRAAGMRTVAVLTGVALAEELAPLADVVMPDIGGLGAWLDTHSPG